MISGAGKKRPFSPGRGGYRRVGGWRRHARTLSHRHDLYLGTRHLAGRTKEPERTRHRPDRHSRCRRGPRLHTPSTAPFPLQAMSRLPSHPCSGDMSMAAAMPRTGGFPAPRRYRVQSRGIGHAGRQASAGRMTDGAADQGEATRTPR